MTETEIARFQVPKGVKDALVAALPTLPVPAGMRPMTIKEYCAMAVIKQMERDGITIK